MNTAEEKTNEIILKYLFLKNETENGWAGMDTRMAIKCAIIHVTGIIESLNYVVSYTLINGEPPCVYWKEVLAELTKKKLTMEISATITQSVTINPQDVIQKLIENEIGNRSWITEIDGKFYKCFERSAGCHSIEDQYEITSEKYALVVALNLVLNNLNKIK